MPKTLILLLLLLPIISNAQKKGLYSAQNKAFNYLGRIDFSNPEVARYDWSAVQVRFRFTGKELAIHFKGGERNYFNLIIDGELKEVLHSPGDTVARISGIKGRGPHGVQFFKRTEGEMGETLFYGVELEPSGELLPWNEVKERRIEFVGNSITCGYGTEGANRDEDFRPDTENAWKSYGAIIARAFDADYHLISHSGMGVVRNYGDKQKISTGLATMPQRYARVLDMDPALTWNFTQWQPQAVVINLGTNDFSTLPYPDKVVFQRHYERLIAGVRERYGAVPVFCVVGPMIDEPCYSYVKEMVSNYKTLYNDGHLYFAGIPIPLLSRDEDLGSDWHPSYKGQKKMAAHLLPLLSTVLQWDYELKE